MRSPSHRDTERTEVRVFAETRPEREKMCMDAMALRLKEINSRMTEQPSKNFVRPKTLTGSTTKIHMNNDTLYVTVNCDETKKIVQRYSAPWARRVPKIKPAQKLLGGS